jgi:hypothetical protein
MIQLRGGATGHLVDHYPFPGPDKGGRELAQWLHIEPVGKGSQKQTAYNREGDIHGEGLSE